MKESKRRNEGKQEKAGRQARERMKASERKNESKQEKE